MILSAFEFIVRCARAANDTARAQINNPPSKSHFIPLLFIGSWAEATRYVEVRVM